MNDGGPAACELCRFDGPMPMWSKTLGILECPKCRLIFYPYPSETGPLYDNGYFQGGEYRDYAEDKGNLQANFEDRLKDVLKRVPSGGRVFEIGCAYGYFLEMARAHYEVEGVDVAGEAVESARKAGLKAHCAEFLDMPDQKDAYDAVCLWDTVEHLSHPVRVMEKVFRWLKPGGHIFITTGDIGGFVPRFRKERWRLIHPPTHLFYFSKATLTKALLKTGFSIAETAYPGYSRSYRSMVYGVFPGKWARAVFTMNGAIDFPVYLNMYDILLCVARKPTLVI